MSKDDLRRRLKRLTGDRPKAEPAGRPVEPSNTADPEAPAVEAVRDVASAKERLRRLLQAKGRGLEFADAVRRMETPSHRRDQLRNASTNLEELVDGEWRETPHGRVFVVERHFPLNEYHAGEVLGGLLEVDEAVLELVEGCRPPGFSFRRAVFLDTETTGLAGGTGTLPFLVGVGRFTVEGYRFRQFFVDDPAAERGQLELLGEWLADCGGLVTYNGRCFDWPLLRDRYLLAGLRPDFLRSEPSHVDLLMWVRRLWRHRLPSCSLGETERGVLGFERTDDVPGAEIPALYFAYLRGAPVGERLARVFYHNEQDILSLPVLAARALRLVERPLERFEDPAELYSLGRLANLGHRRDELWETALSCGLDGELGARTALELSLHYKRRQDFDRARPLWERLRRGTYDRRPYEEEAKYLEHRAREYAAAAELIEEALGRARRVLTDPEARRRDLESLGHRLDRLRRRLAGLPIRHVGEADEPAN
ncbi:MAG: hypothetical protein GF403_02605 [Candidatus Coatesbacteria bacterium]|nr:hypothetical protein [Candidatus Coatesbacteria bacterium]